MNNDTLNAVTLMPAQISRRGFLKLTGLTGGGFVLASALEVTAESVPSLVGSVELNAYVQITDDGTITIYSGSPEMGQGIKTSLPMIVAEEMGADWDDVVVVQTPGVDTERYGRQSAGGSYTLYLNWNLMRQMGATAGDMFLSAAAVAMELPKKELKAENSRVVHAKTGESRTFAELAGLAYRQPIPDKEDLVYKGRQDYTIIGTAKSQVDSLEIVTGVGDFGIDTRVPDMLYGVYEKCPAVGGRILSANIEEVKNEPGVVDAYVITGNGNVRELMDGVGIVGDSTWAVYEARKKLRIKWDEADASKDSWAGFVEFARSVEAHTGNDVKLERGDVDAAFTDANNKVLNRFYEYPYVFHLCLEPMNCTAHYKVGRQGEEDSLEVWLPTQNGPRFQEVADRVYGLKKEQLDIHIKRMGGSFGRRSSNEYACEAIELSKRSGRPVKLTWSREDSMRYDFFREGGFNKLRAAINPQGQIAAWEEQTIGVAQGGKPSRFTGPNPRAFPFSTMENVRGSLTTHRMDTLVGPWRAPYSNTHAFVSQSFIHELAVAAGRDHVELLIEMMGEAKWLEEDNIRALNTGRAVDVIKLAAEKAGWGRAMPSGHGLGFAFYFCHAAHVAEVAEVTVDGNRNLTLNKVTAAIDVGPIINMSGAISQVQGAIIDGFSTMVGQKITMEAGRIKQTNLDEYPVLRIDAAPEIDVHFIQSDYAPTGLGEPALPPLAPAVANAIFAATGERVRSMPLTELGYKV
jgi:isoquinoline 1-oxidoreductase beta subunit|tara:strand:- start:12086 stop:14320 length:2235 start_codon:yes stop_codon:yes gene_type:complete